MNENFFGERVVSPEGKTVLKRKEGFKPPVSVELPKVEDSEETMKNKLRDEIKQFRENKESSN